MGVDSVFIAVYLEYQKKFNEISNLNSHDHDFIQLCHL